MDIPKVILAVIKPYIDHIVHICTGILAISRIQTILCFMLYYPFRMGAEIPPCTSIAQVGVMLNLGQNKKN